MNEKITGLMVYYYHICKRKLWYSTHDISLESENENVQMGKFIDEFSYQGKRKHIMINGEINLDFVEKTGMIHEVKKSRKIEEASVWQVKYYLYYLKKCGVCNISAKIDYPLLKKTIEVHLMEADEEKMQEIVTGIQGIIACEKLPPMLCAKGVCKNCAYNDLCMI